jgi:acetyltransferase
MHGTAAMPAHPSDQERVVELEGDRFVLRPMRPEDRVAYAAFIARIDASDLRRRFFHRAGLSPDIDFERYATIDHGREIAFIAVHEPSPGLEEIVGEARLHRYPGTQTAELAIIVRGDMQRRGLGRALVQRAIEHCAVHGLEMLAQILSDNDAMIRLAKSVGMQVENTPGSDLTVAHLYPPA